MKLKFCSCRHCKAGRKHSRNQPMIVKVKRHARRLTKQLIRQGDYAPPVGISVPYTTD